MRAPEPTMRRARTLRRNLSPPEARLWVRLRARIDGAPAFRRQHPIGPFVLDFYCALAKLAVEVDGFSHDVADRPERDERRDAWLNERGIQVLRIPAADVMRDADHVADGVRRLAEALAATPPPPR